jgi:CRISPR-associated protein Cas5d
MVNHRSPTLSARAQGPLACFTRPELKVERVSYPVITPSAARGILEAVLWKPAIAWHIERIQVLKEIKFTSFRRNEVNSKAVAPAASVIKHGGTSPLFFADQDRAQRNTVALADVDYLIEAHFTMTGRARPDDNLTKFVDMFERRLEKGQHFHQPYFGCREFVADLISARDAPEPIDDSRDLGLMLWDIRFGTKRNVPEFFRAKLRSGVMEIPIQPDTLPNNSKSADER